ncbi:MAG: DUF4328 domain-containing protein [Nannocystaceae bacterium]|nr:DUF4328 domain-containing protein [Nannocystaceae bacterium]
MPSGVAAAALLGAVAVLPLLLTALGYAGVYVPMTHVAQPLIRVVAVVVTLVWLHRAFVALRGRTKFSPGFAVACWFIPLGNLFLPALVFRDAWRASRGRGGGLALVWMPTWWMATALGILPSLGFGASSDSAGGPVLIHLRALDQSVGPFESLSLETFSYLYSGLHILIFGAAFGLLALIVINVSKGQQAQ